jgi:hypothetical protein
MKNSTRPSTTASPRNLSQLKAFLQPGMMLTRTHSRLAPQPLAVTVGRVQSNAFTLMVGEGESWHTFRKASSYKFTDTGFSVVLGGGRHGVVTYLYLTEKESWPGGSVGKGVPAFNAANIAHVEASNEVADQHAERATSADFQRAAELGAKAFERGASCVPALDEGIHDLIRGKKVGTMLPIWDAWTRAWTLANLAAPV